MEKPQDMIRRAKEVLFYTADQREARRDLQTINVLPTLGRVVERAVAYSAHQDELERIATENQAIARAREIGATTEPTAEVPFDIQEVEATEETVTVTE